MAALERTPEEVETSSRGVSTQIQGLLEARGRVVEVVKSYIPEVTIYTIDCGDLKIKFDIHSKLLKLKQNDEVSVVIGKELPEFRRGVDFLAWGYVISLKRGE
ncbi:MAG: DNA-directed RNA polymerase subunit G, partial [Sulfolobales archaeon]|nr:DNA-directed RNA polymerase subunit G [Sulfolobales archaeon]